MTFKDEVDKILSPEEKRLFKRAFDVVGDIAILEIDEELRHKEKEIAEALLRSQKNISAVVRKDGAHEGRFRLQRLKHLAGEKKKETMHKENNVRLLLNPEKVYFSARLATERKRIAELVEEGEHVLVMFSGCGPYLVVIAKNTPAKEVIGIEENPAAHEYAEENVKLNKLSNITLYQGDVRKVISSWLERPQGKKTAFDRILMPLPKSAEEFLDTALAVAKKGTIIHMYDFLHEDDFHLAEEKVRKLCPKAKILGLTRCGQQSARTYRVCIDFIVA